MKLFVKTLRGKLISIEAETTDTVAMLKEKLKYLEITTELIKFNGQVLTDSMMLSKIGITDNSIIDFNQD